LPRTSTSRVFSRPGGALRGNAGRADARRARRDELRSPVSELVRRTVTPSSNGSSRSSSRRATTARVQLHGTRPRHGSVTAAVAACRRRASTSAAAPAASAAQVRHATASIAAPRQPSATATRPVQARSRTTESEHVAAVVIAPAELLSRVKRNRAHASRLIRWLVDEGFAVRVGGGSNRARGRSSSPTGRDTCHIVFARCGRGGATQKTLADPELERWLVGAGFATVVDGGLVATQHARELVAALRPRGDLVTPVDDLCLPA
jgi:hypothetical protein